nr:dna (cytosine-5)-methyltransferase 2 [Quercus suber]
MNLFGKENVANDGTNDDSDSDEADGEDKEVFEVERILAICYSESYFKVCRKGNKAFTLVILLQRRLFRWSYEGHNLKLEEKLLLKYAIFDLPDVENDEHWDEIPYNETPQAEFQMLIRYGKDKLLGPPKKKQLESVLYDHRPLELNNDDSEHVYYYKLDGPVKERHIQVGNVIAVPVARALGYALSSTCQGCSGINEPLFRLPPKFSTISRVCSSAAAEDDA